MTCLSFSQKWLSGTTKGMYKAVISQASPLDPTRSPWQTLTGSPSTGGGFLVRGRVTGVHCFKLRLLLPIFHRDCLWNSRV